MSFSSRVAPFYASTNITLELQLLHILAYIRHLMLCLFIAGHVGIFMWFLHICTSLFINCSFKCFPIKQLVACLYYGFIGALCLVNTSCWMLSLSLWLIFISSGCLLQTSRPYFWWSPICGFFPVWFLLFVCNLRSFWLFQIQKILFNISF